MTDPHSWTTFAQKTTRTEPSPLLAQVLAHRDAGPRPAVPTAIDLGCGAGNEVLALLERGWYVNALDRDAGVLGLLRERAADHADALETVRGEFHQMPRREYGLILAQRSLNFTTPGAWAAVWQIIRESVAVNGLVAVKLFGMDDELLPPGRRTLVSLEETGELLPGFNLLALDEERGKSRRVRDGSVFDSHQITLIARRP